MSTVIIEALHKFFHKLPEPTALMWHHENITAGKKFTVPLGKIYEVYLYSPTNSGTWEFFDAIGSTETFISFCSIPPGVWEPFYSQVVDNGIGGTYNLYQTLPHGWEFSENESVYNPDGLTFRVRWRDITHRR